MHKNHKTRPQKGGSYGFFLPYSILQSAFSCLNKKNNLKIRKKDVFLKKVR